MIPALDGLRGLAALLVLCFHFFKNYPINGDGVWKHLQYLTSFGQTGVDLFFVLSGFLISRILLATKDRPAYFSSFYIRRSLRIFPLYFLGLLLYFFVVMPLLQQPIPSFKLQWWYWVYLEDVGIAFECVDIAGPAHFWTLAVEEHFYLVWPLVIYLVPKHRLALACYVTIAIALFSRALMVSQGFNYMLSYFTPCRLDALAIGALLAVWESEGRLAVMTKYLFLVCAALVLVMAGISLMFSHQFRIDAEIVKYLIYGLVYGWVVGVIRNYQSLSIPVLSSPFMRWTGKISYGLYVYHHMVIELMVARLDKTQFSKPILFAICIGASYLLAWVSYRYFESWFLQLKDKVTTRTVEPPKSADQT